MGKKVPHLGLPIRFSVVASVNGKANIRPGFTWSSTLSSEDVSKTNSKDMCVVDLWNWLQSSKLISKIHIAPPTSECEWPSAAKAPAFDDVYTDGTKPPDFCNSEWEYVGRDKGHQVSSSVFHKLEGSLSWVILAIRIFCYKGKPWAGCSDALKHTHTRIQSMHITVMHAHTCPPGRLIHTMFLSFFLYNPSLKCHSGFLFLFFCLYL